MNMIYIEYKKYDSFFRLSYFRKINFVYFETKWRKAK